jgi:hypothetical protein
MTTKIQESEDDKLKLIYVLKIGYNSKYEGLYEFIFSLDDANVDIEGWCWDLAPACDNALPPTENYINKVISLKTNAFNLTTLHENVQYAYVFGYHTIHALAFESEMEDGENADGYQQMFEDDDVPLLVFHYGMTLGKVKELLNARKIILKNNEFVDISSVKF